MQARSAIAMGIMSGFLLCAQPVDNISLTAFITPVQLAKPVPIEVAAHMVRYNKELSVDAACDIYRVIERAIIDMRAGRRLGAIPHITPELFLALVLVESGANNNSTSHKGAVGMAQIMPLHIPSLKEAGILQKGSVCELRETEKNIRAGVYILMQYAQTARSVEEALARYNAGIKGERHGVRYARKVLALYREII